MKFIGMFLTIVAAGVCLLFLNKYIDPKDENNNKKPTYIDSVVEQQRIKKSNEQIEADFKSNGTKLFCVKHIEKHHGTKLDKYDVIRLTPTFGAISYNIGGQHYRAHCIMKSTSNEVVSFESKLVTE